MKCYGDICICPGFTEHARLSDNYLASVEGARERLLSIIPLGRLATPDDASLTTCCIECPSVYG